MTTATRQHSSSFHGHPPTHTQGPGDELFQLYIIDADVSAGNTAHDEVTMLWQEMMDSWPRCEGKFWQQFAGGPSIHRGVPPFRLVALRSDPVQKEYIENFLAMQKLALCQRSTADAVRKESAAALLNHEAPTAMTIVERPRRLGGDYTDELVKWNRQKQMTPEELAAEEALQRDEKNHDLQTALTRQSQIGGILSGEQP